MPGCCHKPLPHSCCLHWVQAEGFLILLVIHAACAGFEAIPCGAATPAVRGKLCNTRRLQSYLCSVFSILLQILVLIYKGCLILTYFNSHLINYLTWPPLSPIEVGSKDETTQKVSPRLESPNGHSPGRPRKISVLLYQ